MFHNNVFCIRDISVNWKTEVMLIGLNKFIVWQLKINVISYKTSIASSI
jgi:hypothetical protein